jgi:dTDP-4-dehydrorhamnose reductase
MADKILIFGSEGYVGSGFMKLYPGSVGPKKMNIANKPVVSDILAFNKPDVVINCAGKTGRPNIDWCEDHKLETFESNVTGAMVLLQECLKRDIYFVHVGSGCIYEGPEDKAFTEKDEPNFTGSFYSQTKAWADSVMRKFPVLNLRLRMPFDASDSPRNLINKLKGYAEVWDRKNSLTYMEDFYAVAKELITRRIRGTFNVVNPGVSSPAETMRLYKEIVDPTHEFTVVPDLKTFAPRSNCVLSTVKLKQHLIHPQDVEFALHEALIKMREAKPAIVMTNGLEI